MTAAQETNLRMSTAPETVEWPESHFLFVEKTGPFMQTAPQAWGAVYRLMPELRKDRRIVRHFCQYCRERQIYRAGFSVDEAPDSVPEGLTYEKLRGGAYGRFVLNGSYAQLPEATRRAYEIVEAIELPRRADYNIEYYVNSPRDTPEEELVTEILFPLA